MTTVPGMLSAARALMQRDFRLLWQRRGDALQPALFALLVILLFALPLRSERELLARSAPAIIWVAVLLAGLLSLDSLFRSDADDSSLEQWMLSPVPLAWLIFIRTLTHWLTTAVPMIIISPLLAELLYLPHPYLPHLLLGLGLGTPILSLIGAVIAALTVTMRGSSVLLALLALPLYIPVLIFGAGSVIASVQGLDASGGFLMLAAGLVISLVLAPIAAATAVRIAMQ